MQTQKLSCEKMDLEVKKRWVAALRSGAFAQGRGSMRVQDCYCCLGVLCSTENIPAMPKEGHRFSFDGLEGLLSLNLMGKFGISQAVQDFLVSMNDVAKLNFNQIADWIEANL